MVQDRQEPFEVLYARWHAAEAAVCRQWQHLEPVLERALEGGPVPAPQEMESMQQLRAEAAQALGRLIDFLQEQRRNLPRI